MLLMADVGINSFFPLRGKNTFLLVLLERSKKSNIWNNILPSIFRYQGSLIRRIDRNLPKALFSEGYWILPYRTTEVRESKLEAGAEMRQ